MKYRTDDSQWADRQGGFLSVSLRLFPQGYSSTVLARLLGIMLLGLLVACDRTSLEQVIAEGELRVLTRNSPTTYYEGPDGPTGLEHELARLFAASLGVKLKLVPVSTTGDIFDHLDAGNADLAAAGLSITEERLNRYRYTRPYMQVHSSLVYRSGDWRPRSMADTTTRELLVISNTSHTSQLQRLKVGIPQLQWSETATQDIHDLLESIVSGRIGYTIVDSNDLAVLQPQYPDALEAFALPDREQLAWAFPRRDDVSLFEAADRFIQAQLENGMLLQLTERFYGLGGQGYTSHSNYVGERTYLQHINQRLPAFEAFFRAGAKQNSLDWRLLAAMGYQESRWQAQAVSPTGLKGIMMLTRGVASEVGVKNRFDPQQSIQGSAAYLGQVYQQLPAEIMEPDRTWLALAAYHVGLGHLLDGFDLTRKNGKDPARWSDVRQYLPLLGKRQFYSRAQYGYMPGDPVKYVENIRRYRDVLAWSSQGIEDPVAEMIVQR